MNTKRITDLLGELDWLFGTHNFERDLIVKTEDDINDGKKCHAEIFFDEKYQTIEVTIYPCFFKETLEKQRKTILHEMIHTITLPSKSLSCDMLEGKLVTEEQVTKANEIETSKLENIIDSLLKNNKHYAKDAYKKYIDAKKTKSN
jgi:hypothetical protein